MSLKALVSFNEVVGMIFGLALLFAPGFLLATYGLGADDATLLIARLLGAEFLGFNTVSLLVREHIDEPAIGRSFVIGRCLSEGSGFAVSLLGALMGVGNGLVWVIVTLYALFTVGFLSVLLRGQAAYRPL